MLMWLDVSRIVVVAAIALCVVPPQGAVAGTRRLGRYFDDIGAVPSHSFHLPLLADVVESGIHSWSFGGGAVLTNEYARLSPAIGEGHGYLWNQFPSELKSWSISFTLRVYQRPHGNAFTSAGSGLSGAAFWALKEPTRHGDTPFFGVPSAFVGAGVIVTQGGSLHVVGRDTSDGPAHEVDPVSHGRCKLSITGDVVTITLKYSAHDQTLDLSYSERGANPTHCASGAAEHLPPKYYLGFTSQVSMSTPVGYEVLGMSLVPMEGAQERPIDMAEYKEAESFDHKLDEDERDFWEEHGDELPKGAAHEKQEEHQQKPHESHDGRDIPHHAQQLRRDAATSAKSPALAGDAVEARRFAGDQSQDAPSQASGSDADADLHRE